MGPHTPVNINSGSFVRSKNYHVHICNYEVLFKTCVAMKFVDNDDELTLKYNNVNVEKMLCKMAYIKH